MPNEELSAGQKILEATRDLRTLVPQMSVRIEQLLKDHSEGLPTLNAVINDLGQPKPCRPVHCPSEYVAQWKQYLLRAGPPPSRRAVRYLCWEPDIATHLSFLDHLGEEEVELRAGAIQGLVRSCHSRWSADFAAARQAKLVKQILDDYDGPNRIVRSWKDDSSVLLGRTGHEQLAAKMIQDGQPLKSFSEKWKLEERSPYFLLAVQSASDSCRTRLRPNSRSAPYLLNHLLTWDGWPISDFKRQVSATILVRDLADSVELRDQLKSLVCRDLRLGDPRLPANQRHWVGMPEEAKKKLIQWLSRADIVFFFDHVLPDREDRQGRKAFWLRYVPSVRVSRPLLSRDDRVRLRVALQKDQNQAANYGRLTGNSSAFLLDFGDILVIEFSNVGACYVYRRRDVATIFRDFWMPEHFLVNDLKLQQKCIARVVHRGSWQGDMTRTLAQNGIRPSL